MNKKDLLIVSLLRRNARETLTNISKQTKIPISTIYERIRMNNDGIVKKFTSIIDFSKLGFTTRANIMIKADKESREGLRTTLLSSPHVNSLYRINNGYDFLVEGVFRDLQQVEEFFEKLEEKYDILEKEVHYVLDDLKRESFMDDPQLLDLLEV
mgnify:CR=1 FL=1